MGRWSKGIRVGLGAMVMVGILTVMVPAASAASTHGLGHRITPHNVYFY